MGERRVEYTPLDQVRRAPRNPRRHDEAGIRQSLSGFGVVDLPVIDERTGRLVSGHGRLDQLMELHNTGQDAPEGVRVSGDGGWLVPVVRGWASRDDREAEAYLVATNKLGENGGWIDDGLAELLADLETDRELLTLTGFSDAELSALLTGEPLPSSPQIPWAGSDNPFPPPAAGVYPPAQLGGHPGQQPPPSPVRPPPAEFPSYDETIRTEHSCPACGYRWSGGN